ncbi:MAG: hypothetical protein HQL38_14810 [Alphaproteobacteria bacterium]|nr:hypothetical protein [Alphaproteobacteria bacterium]MBF0393946.1 hypothetical protein [Alphaproteobacteria bacterium]
MALEIVSEEGSHRLVRDGRRWAVIEVRGERVLAAAARGERGDAPDTTEGMTRVIEEVEGWRSESTARRRFRGLVDEGEKLSRIIW